MYSFLTIIFLTISIIQAKDYDINDQQICTRNPFTANFPHNCSRARLFQIVDTPNTNTILHITIIFDILNCTVPKNCSLFSSTLQFNTLFTITKSDDYDQLIYFTFFSWNQRSMYINNNTNLSFEESTASSYLYNTSSEQFTQQMKPSKIVIIFLTVSVIQTTDYAINDQQICTRNPFTANFNHNCSRARLLQTVDTPNTNAIIHITIIFDLLLCGFDGLLNISPTGILNTSFTITKSDEYDQLIYFTFFSWSQRSMYINNKTNLTFGASTINSYLYNTSSEQFSLTINPLPIVECNCALLNKSFTPENVTRVYYLNTDAINLNIDLSTSSYYIPPMFDFVGICLTTETKLSTGGKVFIILISVFSFITIVLIAICLRKQLKELWHIFTNYLKEKRGQGARVRVDH
ncbi:unnamed protein product [Adineta steineri]|uniref:Transmembrane protein n=1 Tax=Adineta steineri TaxID=433720 RepID=A0A814CYL4_9BILA|nr:unnamed protein product [Adineta steineri]